MGHGLSCCSSAGLLTPDSLVPLIFYHLQAISHQIYGKHPCHNRQPFHSLHILSSGKCYNQGFPGGSVVENPPANEGDLGSIPGSGRSPGEGNGNPFQYSCLGNFMDRGAWWAIVHGVTKSRTQLSDWKFIHSHFILSAYTPGFLTYCEQLKNRTLIIHHHILSA